MAYNVFHEFLKNVDDTMKWTKPQYPTETHKNNFNVMIKTFANRLL